MCCPISYVSYAVTDEYMYGSNADDDINLTMMMMRMVR